MLINLASDRTSRSLITLQDRRATEAAVQQRGVFDRLDRSADDRHRRRGPYRQHRVITLSLSPSFRLLELRYEKRPKRVPSVIEIGIPGNINYRWLSHTLTRFAESLRVSEIAEFSPQSRTFSRG